MLRHGMAHTRIYKIWTQMKQRCSNPKNKNFASYGGRGIKVCERWQQFENFFADMGERPNGKMLERKNNNGNYGPGNCEWAPNAVQYRNRQHNVWLGAFGVSAILAEWAKALGMNISTLSSWVRKNPDLGLEEILLIAPLDGIRGRRWDRSTEQRRGS